MSYSFTMFFTHCENEADAYRKAVAYSKVASKPENIKYYLEQNVPYYIPSIRYRLNNVRDFTVGIMVDEYWMQSQLTLRFVFWPQHNLLGLVGHSHPEVLKFFAKSVHFQNSTDQDYEYSTWENVCPFFDEVVEKYHNATAQELIASGFYNDYTEDELNRKLTYHQRSCVYDSIYEGLELNKWLWNNESNAFEMFTLSLFNKPEAASDAKNQLRQMVRSYDTYHWMEDSIIIPVTDGGGAVQLYEYTFKQHSDGKPSKEQFLQKVTEAVQEYKATDDGKRVIQHIGSRSVYDILQVIPDMYLRKRNIRRMDSNKYTEAAIILED